MNRSILAAAIAITAVTLTACDSDNQEQQAQAEARARISGEETELKAALAQLKEKDPTVKDVYYGQDENGERTLHVVKETEKEGASSMVWPLLGGMAAGALVGHMLSSGGPSQYAQSYPPSRTQSYYSRDDERRDRNTTTSAYAGGVLNRSRTMVSSPSYRPSPSASALSTRSSSVFSSSTSARSGGYSAGA